MSKATAHIIGPVVSIGTYRLRRAIFPPPAAHHPDDAIFRGYIAQATPARQLRRTPGPTARRRSRSDGRMDRVRRRPRRLSTDQGGCDRGRQPAQNRRGPTTVARRDRVAIRSLSVSTGISAQTAAEKMPGPDCCRRTNRTTTNVPVARSASTPTHRRPRRLRQFPVPAHGPALCRLPVRRRRLSAGLAVELWSPPSPTRAADELGADGAGAVGGSP